MSSEIVIQTEKSVLALMLDRECRSKARSAIQSRWFYRTNHRQMFESAIEWDRENSEEFSLVGWGADLSNRGLLEVVGGLPYIAGVCEFFGSAKNLDAYGRILREDWERREIGKLGLSLQENSKDRTKSPLDLAHQATSAAEIVRQRISEDVTGEQAMIEAAMRNSAGTVHTGFPDLDRVLGGMSPGSVTTLAGRTGMGKTAFATDVIRNLSRDGVPVGYVTLEMDAAEVHERVLRVPYVPSRAIRYWYPSRRSNPDSIAAQGGRWASDGLGLLVVDHLGLVSNDKFTRSRYEQVSENAREMKRIARTLKCPVLILCQLSRKAADGKPPSLADLRDSGEIEEISDAVILLHRPGYYDPSKDQSEAWAILAKNRHGRTKSVRIHWNDELGIYGSIGHGFPNG